MIDLKTAAVLIGIVATLAGGIYAAEDRYATNKGVAQSLDLLDVKIGRDLDKVELNILQQRKAFLDSQYFNTKNLRRTYPNDSELKEEFDNIIKERLSIDARIKEKLER